MHMDNIVIFGAGLHANSCIDIVEKEGRYKIVGILDSYADVGSVRYGYEIIGRQEQLPELIKAYNIQGGLICVGDNYGRQIVRDAILSLVPDFVFVNAIHPWASIGRNVIIGTGAVIMARVVINADCVVEDFCILNTGAQLEHNGILREFAHLSAGVVTGGKVDIGKYALIAPGAVVADRVTIGENTVVGLGALVLKDLPDNVVAYGSPAKAVRTRLPGEKVLKSM